MKNETDFHYIVGYVYYASAAVSTFLNALSIILVLTRSPKQMGAYKHLMIIISVYEILYSLLDAFLVPIHYSHGSAIVELVSVTDKPVGRSALVFLNLVYWMFYGASLTILSLHFIYRWLVVSENPLVSSFHSWKLMIWLLIPVFMGVVWMATGYYLCSPDKETSDYMRHGILETFGKSIDDFEFFAVHAYDRTASGEVQIHYRSIVSLTIMLLTLGCTLSVIIFFGVKCYRRITNMMDLSSSNQSHRLQTQLFHALVAQTLVPVFLVHIPTALLLLFALLNVDLGRSSALVSISVALYTSIEPLPNLFIVKAYRKAMIDFLKCRHCRREHTHHSNASVHQFPSSSYIVPASHSSPEGHKEVLTSS